MHEDEIHGGDFAAALKCQRERILAQRRFEAMLARQAVEKAEVAARTAIVREAKDRHARRELPLSVLDRILPDAVPKRRKEAAR